MPASVPPSQAFSPATDAAEGLQKPISLKATQRFDARPNLRDRALLVRSDATNSGQVHALDEDSFGVGRHPDNSAAIDDGGLSRFHLRITRKGSVYWVEDLDSSNGTYLNGRRIASCELANGDTIQLGPRVTLRFSLTTAQEEQVLKDLYESSVKDAMTRLFNRQYFATQLEAEASYAIRHREALSLLMIDIDFFKKVNDSLGHQAGDTVLKAVAAALVEQLRTEDVIARYGGEEFIVLLRGIDLDGARLAAERLCSAVRHADIRHEGSSIPVTVSIGATSLACLKSQGDKQLVKLADARLYAAKKAGRNRVVASGH